MADITNQQLLDGLNETLSVITDNMVTKGDLAKVEAKLTGKIDGVEAKLTKRINGVEAKLTQKIDGVETKLTDRIDGVESRLTDKIDGVETRLGARLKASHTANVGHHLETRAEIASLHRKIDAVSPAKL